MLQPKRREQLDANIKELLANGGSNEDIEKMAADFTSKFGNEVPLKKKDVSDSISENQKLDLAPKTGSSDSNISGFPEIKSNDIITPEFDKMKPSELKKTPKETPKERGFVSEVFHKLATGSAQLGADIASTPELIYDAFSVPQNVIADYFDIPYLKADSDKFKKTIGITNAIKENYKNEVLKLREESAIVDKKYQADIYNSFKNGDIADGFRQLTNTFAESLPATSSIMIGGAFAKAPQILAASTMVFGSGKNEQLKEENPEMSTNARVTNALGTGLAEGAFETIGSGSIGAAAKGLIEREGQRKATTILKDGLVNFYKEALKKNPLTASMAGEGIEEWATQITQNTIDVATGAKDKDYNVFTGSVDAFLGGAFGGAVFGGGLKGIQKVVSIQDRKAIKQNADIVFNLQSELNNPEISETTKTEIHKTIDDLIVKNRELIQNGVNNIESLGSGVKSKLEESIAKLEEIKKKTKEIDLDNTSEETKKVLLKNLKAQAKEAYDLRNSILEGKTTEVDVLPLKEQETLKKQAMEDLVTELNPDGKKDITITNEQVVQRANEILKESKENEKNPEPNKTDGPPPAPEDYNIVDEKPTINKDKSDSETTKKIYHATTAEFDGLPTKIGKRTYEIGAEPAGIFYSTNPEDAKHATGEGKDQRIIEAEFTPKNTLEFNDFEESENSKIFEDAKKQASEDTVNHLKEKGFSDEDVKMWKDNEMLGSVPRNDTEGGFFAHRFADILKEKGYDSVHNTRTNDIIVLDQSTTKEIKNETIPPTNTSTDGNIQPRVEPNDSKRKNDNLSGTTNSNPSEGQTKEVVVDGDDLILNHGTPHDFDSFQLEKIGTGEGAQAFGYGLYFTDGSKIAKGYAEKLSEDKTGIVYQVRIKNGRTANWAEWRQPLSEKQEQDLYNSLTEEEKKQYQEHFDKAFDYQSPNYDIKYEQEHHGSFEDLKPNSEGVVDYGGNDKPSSAGSIYSDLKDAFGQQKATDIFKRAGIEGIKYKAKKGLGDNYNYVVFNPESISIENKSNKTITTKKVKSVRNAEYEVDFDQNGNVVAIRSSKDGRVIPKFVERKVKPSKKNPTGKTLSKNANYSKIESDATGEKTQSQLNEELKEKRQVDDEKIRAFEPSNEYEAALKYVAQGGKVKLSDAKSETGERNSKAMKWAAGFNKESDLPSIENVAENIAGDNENLNEDGLRDALIDIFTTFESLQAVKDSLLETYDVNNAKKQEEELYHFLGSLTEKERAMYESIQAEDSYFEELTDQELDEYHQEKINEYEQGQREYAKQETANQKPNINPESNEESEGRKGESKESKSPELKQVEKDLEKANNNLRTATEALDRKAKLLDKELLKDNEDLFGERKSQQEQKLFDERVDSEARNKATEKERQAIKEAKEEVKKLTELKSKIEKGEVESTSEIDFAFDEFGDPTGPIEHESKAGLSKERVKHEKITPKNSPKKLSNIIKDVAKGLKAHLINSRPKKRNTLGSYNPRNVLIRITRAGDIDTVAHELGHLLDDRFDILGTIPQTTQLAILRQLKWYSDRGGSNPPAKATKAQKVEYLEREGLAEFIRSFVANPTQTKILAPELLAHFENTIDAKTKEVLTQFSIDFLDLANATGIERTLANVEETDLPNKNKFIEWVKGFRNGDDKLSFTNMDKFYAQMANSNHFGIKAFKTLLGIQGKTEIKTHENFEIISRLFYGVNGKLENVFAKGMINGKNERLKAEGGVFSKNKEGRTVYGNGTAMNVSWLIDGLDTTTEETLNKEMNLVVAMGVAERTVEYVKKLGRTDNLVGTGAGIETDLSVALDALNEFKELKKTNPDQYKRIKEGLERYRKMADATLLYAVDKGRISQEQYDSIKESNEFYIALNRNKELEPGEDMFSSFNTGTNGIGAAKEIIHRAKGGTATIENPYLSLLKNINNIIKEADRNEVMMSFVAPLISNRKMGEGDPVELSKIGFIANDGDTETIKVFRDGKLEKWKFDEDIFKSLKNIESIASSPILDFFATPSQLIRWTVTHNPVFYARNIVKDTQARMVVSSSHSSFKDMIHNSGDKEVFELFGGSQAGHLHTSKESYAKTMKSTITEITKKGGIVLNPMKLGQKYVKFLQTGENLNRIAEFNSSYKVAKENGMSDYDAGLYAAFQARDLMDFAVAGHLMREINKIIPFSNAGVQALRKANKSIQADPAGFAYRTALYSVVPSLVFYALRASMGDDDEEYQNLPDNQKDMFYNFKTPFTGDAWISIPKPYELGLTAALVDRAISKIRGYDEAFDGFTGTMMKTLMPFDESSFLGGLKPLVEVSMNKNTYTGRPIIPEHESGKLLELRKGVSKASLIGQNTSKMFKQVGWSVDPRNIDHVLKGYGTYFSQQGMAVSDLMKKDRAELNFWITKSGFAKDVPTYNAKSVKKASDLAVELGKINSKDMKALRSKIEEFSFETDIVKRKAILKDIFKDSESIIKKLDREKNIVLEFGEKESELESNFENIKRNIPAKERFRNKKYLEAKEALKSYRKEIKNAKKEKRP